MKACVLAAVAWLGSISAQTQPAEQLHAIRGRIIDDVSGLPVTDVEIGLVNSASQASGEAVAPDAEGRFAFSGMPSGDYMLKAVRPDFGTIYYDELPDNGWVQTIDLRPGDGDRTVVFRLIPRSLVSGVVRDELGEPVLRASVTLSRGAWSPKGVVFHQVTRASTDDRGQYRFANLPPGSYVVCAVADQFRSVAAPSPAPVDYRAHPQDRYYQRSCYPKSAGLPRATLEIREGQRTIVDFTLTATSAAQLRGHVDTTLPVSGSVRLVPEQPIETGESWSAGVDSSTGVFEFRGIPPGAYQLWGDFSQMTGTQTVNLRAHSRISVGVSDLGDIELRPEPQAEIEVVIHNPEGAALEPWGANLGLGSVSPDENTSLSALTDEKGDLRFQSVPPGTYWLTQGLPLGKTSYCVQSARLDEQEVLHGQLVVTPGMHAQLHVTVSKRCGTIAGRVVANQKPVPDAKLLLLCSGTPKDPGDVFTYFADERGGFSLTELPFGRYQLWAWSVDEAKSFFGPVSLADAAKDSVAITVDSDQPVNVEIAPMQPGDNSR